MAKRKTSGKAKKSPKKLIRKKASRKSGGRGPSGKKKTSKVHKLLKWLKLRK